MRISFGIFFDIEREPQVIEEQMERESDVHTAHERSEPEIHGEVEDRVPVSRPILGFAPNGTGVVGSSSTKESA